MTRVNKTRGANKLGNIVNLALDNINDFIVRLSLVTVFVVGVKTSSIQEGKTIEKDQSDAF